MVPRVAALLCALALSAGAQIDFTPVTQQAVFEGTAYPQTGFRHGPDFILYEPPAGWTLQGQGPRLEMHPRVSLASASIESRPLAPGRALDADTLERLKQDVLATLPREAEKVEWEPVEVNPILLNRHETRRLTLSYAAFAQRFRVTVVICDFAAEEVVFRLATRADDFDKQYDLFRRSLYTWQGLP